MASKTPAAGTNADIVGTASSARGHSRSHSIPHPKRRHPAYEHEEGDHAASETILGDTASGAFVDPALDGDVGGAAAGYGSEEEAGCRREVEEASEDRGCQVKAGGCDMLGGGGRGGAGEEEGWGEA